MIDGLPRKHHYVYWGQSLPEGYLEQKFWAYWVMNFLTFQYLDSFMVVLFCCCYDLKLVIRSLLHIEILHWFRKFTRTAREERECLEYVLGQ